MTAIKNGTLLVKDSNGNTARVATLSQTDITTLNTALADIDTNKRKISSISANYVTTNTNQNITAIKTIALPSNRHAIIVKDTGTDNTVTPTSTQWQSMTIAVDKNNKERGCVQATLDTNGYSRTKLMAIQQDSSGKNIYNSLELAIKRDGTRLTYLSSSPSSNSNDTSIATTAWVNSKISTGGGSNPVGTIIPFAGSSIPAGYLLCNGATVSRTTYANLFKVIGTTWGAGDGSTTFKLPDTRGRFPEGANGNLGAYHSAGLPNITGHLIHAVGAAVIAEDSFVAEWSNQWWATTGGSEIGTFAFNMSATRSSVLYGKSTTVQPLSFCVQYLIKY